MMTFLAATMLLLLILTALYAFGIFGTAYLGAFRFAFYLILLIFVVIIVFSMGDDPLKGYDPTPKSP
ncbi:MAG: hypothetical protein ABW047_05665 [Nitrospiraceae bacterium]